MNTQGSAVVLFFCFFALFTLTECTDCQKNVLEGNMLTFKLADGSLKDDDRFSLKKDNALIINKKTKLQKEYVTVKDNDLQFKAATLDDSGTYDVDVFDRMGKNQKSYRETVCVYAKVPKPIVNMTCDDEKANFICIVESSKDLSYTWHKNGKDLKENTLKLDKIEPDNSKYACTAKNPLHSNKSDQVEATCYKPPTLFGFDFWMMVGILAGGGGLVLMLAIVLVTVACRSCRRKEKQQRDEEEFRLNYLNTSPSNGQHKSKTTARGQPAPPEPYDNVSAHDVPSETESKPRTQPRARPPPPPAEDEESPPPLPQPRKKAHTKKREGPV